MNVELLVVEEGRAPMAPRGSVASLEHPAVGDIDLLRVLHALSDPTRIDIVSILASGGERACGTFPVDVAASTLSHHFKVLRDAGVIWQRAEGRERLTTLRADDLEQRFPGLIPAIVEYHTAGDARAIAAREGSPCREAGA